MSDDAYDPEVHPSEDVLEPDTVPGHTVLDPGSGAHAHHPIADELPPDSLGRLPNDESESRFD
ncbi:hypothetical protein TESS_TESS_01409 [Tessaracoccus sp. O5.2]|uniref:hypothetical protein n=1 Tax=Tessaracoccus sp. O5.2 TaxID=3157622 RepID=UPI0035E5AD89